MGRHTGTIRDKAEFARKLVTMTAREKYDDHKDFHVEAREGFERMTWEQLEAVYELLHGGMGGTETLLFGED